jgi:hypothetical protein
MRAEIERDAEPKLQRLSVWASESQDVAHQGYEEGNAG